MSSGNGTTRPMSAIPFYVHQGSNCLYVINPITGQAVWIVDYETGQPMSNRQVFVDANTGGLFTTSLSGMGYVWLVDPTTGNVMSQQPQQPAQQQPKSAYSSQSNGFDMTGAQPFGTQSTGQGGFGSESQDPFGMQASIANAGGAPMQGSQAGYQGYGYSLGVQGSPQSSVVPYSQQSPTGGQLGRADAPAFGQSLQQAYSPEQVSQVRQSVPMQQGVTSNTEGQAFQGAAAPSANLPSYQAEQRLQAQESSQSAAVPTAPQGRSGMAIASLVLGIVAILTSFLPIINNGSFFLALLGLVFAIVGIVATGKKKNRKGRGMAVVALILCILSMVLVVATQGMYGKAFDSSMDRLKHGSTPVSATGGESEGDAKSGESGNAQSAKDYSSMTVGESVTFDNGLTVAVTAVEPGLVNFDKSTVTGVTVRYENGGKSNVSFNVYDWKGQDANGALRNESYYSEAKDALHSGDLAPGGSVTGKIYFDGDITKVYYYENSFLQSDSSVGWVL